MAFKINYTAKAQTLADTVPGDAFEFGKQTYIRCNDDVELAKIQFSEGAHCVCLSENCRWAWFSDPSTVTVKIVGKVED